MVLVVQVQVMGAVVEVELEVVVGRVGTEGAEGESCRPTGDLRRIQW